MVCLRFQKVVKGSVERLQAHQLCFYHEVYPRLCRCSFLHHIMRSSELVFTPSSFIFDSCLFGCCTISGFTFYPCDLPNIKFFPIIVGLGEFLCENHGVVSNDDEYFTSDGVVGLLGFGLGTLECVDVLGYSLVLEMAMLHLFFQCEDIEGMKTTTRRLEVGENLLRVNQDVVGIVPLELVDPHVFNNNDDKFTRFVFRGFISGEVADAGLVNGLLPRLHRCLFVVPCGRIVDGIFFGLGKRGGVILCVGHWILNKSNAVMDGVLIIVRNVNEDLGK